VTADIKEMGVGGTEKKKRLSPPMAAPYDTHLCSAGFSAVAEKEVQHTNDEKERSVRVSSEEPNSKAGRVISTTPERKIRNIYGKLHSFEVNGSRRTSKSVRGKYGTMKMQ
jgi:hypothetical protein